MATPIRDRLAERGSRCLQLAVLIAMVSAANLTLSACSSDGEKEGSDGVSSGSGGNAPGSAATGGGVSGGTGGAGANTEGGAGAAPVLDSGVGDGSGAAPAAGSGAAPAAGSGGQAAEDAAPPSAEGGPPPPADAGPVAEGGSQEDSGPPVDCTPSDWVDPGTVPNPELEEIATDAGSTGLAFGTDKTLDQYGYLEKEFLVSNSSPEPYTTRMLARWPSDPAKFSGTVFVEWLNVSGMMDVAVLWGSSREYFMREGHAHVGVSAQLMGIGTLQSYDPERYAALNHPGDQVADAIFAQAAMAVRSQTEVVFGPCMPVDVVLGVGQSQSAMRLASYVDNSQSMYQMYDGLNIHSGPQPTTAPNLPVLMIHTMTEGHCTLPDGPNMVCWEVAGASHNDDRIMTTEIEIVGAAFGLTEAPFECENPMNQYPAYRVYNAALDWLNRWVRNGERAPAGEPFAGDPPMSVVDEYGNAMGGVRLPDIDVPIATHNLDNAALNPLDFLGLMACGLSGSSVYFTEEQLLQMYPTHEIYVEQYTAAADEALANGYLLQEDYDIAIQKAQAAPIPN